MMTILAKGVIRGGQVVVREPINLPDGSEVAITKVASPQGVTGPDEPLAVSPERREALQQLIGIWKTDLPPSDEQIEQILHQERMKKYG